MQETANSLVVVQCNLLHHIPYQKYSKQTCLTPQFRAQAMMQSLEHISGADLLTLQEWSLELEPASAAFQQAIRAHYFVTEFGQNEYMGCCIAVNLKRFEVCETYKNRFVPAPHNGFVCCILRDRSTHTKIGVVSMHLPFGQLERSLSEISGFIASQKHATWIVCGDCNSDRLGTMLRELPGFHTANTARMPTHRSGSDEYQEHDFILHSTNVKMEKPLFVYPDSFHNLLSHNVEQVPTASLFSSDHALLRMTCCIAQNCNDSNRF